MILVLVREENEHQGVSEWYRSFNEMTPNQTNHFLNSQRRHVKNFLFACLIGIILLTGCLAQPSENLPASPTTDLTPAPTSLRVLPTILPSQTPTTYVRPPLKPSATVVPTAKPPVELMTQVNRELTRWAATVKPTRITSPVEIFDIVCQPNGPIVSILAKAKIVTQWNLASAWVRASIFDKKSKQINTSKWQIGTELLFSGKVYSIEALVPDPNQQTASCKVELAEYKY